MKDGSTTSDLLYFKDDASATYVSSVTDDVSETANKLYYGSTAYTYLKPSPKELVL